MKKSVSLLLLPVVLVLAGLGYWYYFLAPGQSYQRNVVNEKSSTITANEIVQQFKTNDTAVNQKYLNKTVAVTGRVGAVETDPEGNTTVTLKSNDSTINVFCTLKPPAPKPVIGAEITVKGICTGLVLSDVVLNEAIIVK